MLDEFPVNGIQSEQDVLVSVLFSRYVILFSFKLKNPFVKDEGSSNYLYYTSNNEYFISGYSPSSWSVDNGYIFYEKDSG